MKITIVMLKSLIVNILISTFKIVTGLIGNSGALVVDGIHSLSDASTDLFAIIGNKLSNKKANKKHPLGYGKIEYLTCIVIGIVIAVVGIGVIYNGIVRQSQIPNVYTAIVGVVIIIAKTLLTRYVYNKGKEYKSNILIASAKESFTDVVSSSIVFISIMLSQLSKFNHLFIYADRVAIIIIGIFILHIAYTIFRDNFSGLLGEQETDEDYLNDVKTIIKNNSEVIDIDYLVILKYGQYYHINCEVSMNETINVKQSHDVLEKIEKDMHTYDEKIEGILIHVNPYKE